MYLALLFSHPFTFSSPLSPPFPPKPFYRLSRFHNGASWPPRLPSHTIFLVCIYTWPTFHFMYNTCPQFNSYYFTIATSFCCVPVTIFTKLHILYYFWYKLTLQYFIIILFYYFYTSNSYRCVLPRYEYTCTSSFSASFFFAKPHFSQRFYNDMHICLLV